MTTQLSRARLGVAILAAIVGILGASQVGASGAAQVVSQGTGR